MYCLISRLLTRLTSRANQTTEETYVWYNLNSNIVDLYFSETYN